MSERRDTSVAGVTATLGVQYASASRLAPPARVHDSTPLGTYGPAAPQPERPIGLFVFGSSGQRAEECLYLNVWAPEGGDHPKPVIVFIHGGGFTIGSGGAPISNGARLARRADAVVVTINYRLGSLGWLFHPDLGGGNWGLHDQIAALEWVRDNIANFGGDPAAVTVMGQSAGALSIVDMLSIDAAQGLFARAILQSPPMHDALHEPDLGVRWADALCREVTAARAFDRDALLAADADAFVAAHERLLASAEFRGTRGGALPIRDGLLPAAPMEAPGARNGIDVLVGTTADEGTFFFRAGGRNIDPSDDELLRIAGHLPGVNDGPAAVAAYSAGSNSETLVRLATDAMVAVPAAAWATARAADGGRVHRYRVEHRSPQPGLGAVHTIDVPLVFGSFADDEGARAMSGDAGDVSEALQGVVRAFVRGEDPGWPSLQANDSAQTVAVFGGPAPIRYEAERQPQLLS